MPDVTLRLPAGAPAVRVDVGPDIADSIERSGGWYERHVMALLPRLLPEDGVGVDIGANAGAVSLAMAAVAARGRVIAFEAAPANADRLVANLTRAGARNVEVRRAAVYDRAGELTLDYDDAATGGASVSRARLGGQTVPAVTLDGWVADAGLERLDLVKLDVEGAELRAIAGARGTLERLRPALIVECNPPSLARTDGASAHDLFAALQAIGYRLGWIAGRGGVIALRDPAALDRALSAAGIVDLVGVADREPRGAQGLQALAGRARARLRARRASRVDRPPGTRFVTGAELRIHVSDERRVVATDEDLTLDVSVANCGSGWLSSGFRPHPVLVTHRWVAEDGADGGAEPRTALPSALGPGRSTTLALTARAPSTPGEWALVIRAVQEHFVWLDVLDPGLARRVAVTVIDRTAR